MWILIQKVGLTFLKNPHSKGVQLNWPSQRWAYQYTHAHTNKLNRDVCFAATLRALYLSDNDFEVLPADIGKLTKLQIVSQAISRGG